MCSNKLEGDEGSTRSSYYSSKIFILFTLFGIVCITLDCYQSTGSDTIFSNFSFLLLLMLLLNSLLSWCLNKGHIATNLLSPLNHVQSCSVLSLTTCLINGLWLVSRSYAGPCSMNHWSCNPSASFNDLPFDALLYLMLTPIIYLELFPHILLKVILVSWSFAVVWISVCIYTFNAYNTVIVTLFYIPTSLLFIYKKQNELYISLLEKEKYQTRIEQIEAQSVNNIKEMKNMLSNVTHDMKTVNKITS